MAHLESVTTQKNISVKCKILLKNILSFLDKIFKIYVETTHCKCGVETGLIFQDESII
ncbi:hypothetical protein [Candidatus Tisiphia endosymbiont of Parasteatoda lunata]|uniref:hypothetical protein n=1 Tax=Candidatus Tisiphia endosymbiont of Parasteatoda lunata TaxID=3066275 RepID=UPI00313B7914